MHLKMFYIVLYITATSAQKDPDPEPACTTVTWEDKVYTKLDTNEKLPKECAPDLVFLDEVGKGFCLEAEPRMKEISEISCTEGSDTSVRLPTHIKPSHYNIILKLIVDVSGSYKVPGDIAKLVFN